MIPIFIDSIIYKVTHNDIVIFNNIIFLLIIMPIIIMLFCFLSQQDELLASQHYDDNSVACIEEKCSVLGMRQYCRYNYYTYTTARVQLQY